jgi:hypothetical protein
MTETFLSGKTILIISPQKWGSMLVSKHHYALELAKRGNQVYYLNPPDNHRWKLNKAEKRINIKQSLLHSNLYLVDQLLYFPYLLKYHFRKLYHLLIRKQISDILEMIGKPVDIIWSFDIGNLFPLSYFRGRSFKIFHPVDEPGDQHAIAAARGADIIFSVTHEILDKYKEYPVGRHFINHGLAEEFIGDFPIVISDKIQTGMSGNLLRTDLDREILLKIIHEHPQVDFHFFGSYQSGQSNLSGEADADTGVFLSTLGSLPNVRFHGILQTSDLAAYLNKMDILLICYDMEKDQSKGTNYHKVIEYLSTGKVIVSNNITTYAGEPDLLRMVSGRENNNGLPVLFSETISSIHIYNSPEKMDKRKAFARGNTYSKQLDAIHKKIEQLIIKRTSI